MRSAKIESRYSALFIALGVFLSLIVGVECLTRATGKEFGGDEFVDLNDTIQPSPKKQLFEKAINQSGSAPIHFAMQHLTVRTLLKSEMEKGRGLDWRISLRLWPTAAIVLGCIAAILLLYKYSLGVALALPVLMANQTYVTFYGAENRIYGAWMGASLLFYALSLVYVLNPRRLAIGVAWIASAALLTGVAVTAPVQIYSMAAVILGTLAFWRQPLKRPALLIATGCVVSVILMKFWNVHSTPFALKHANLSLSFYLQHYWKYALAPFGHERGLARTLALSIAMIAYWSFDRKSERRRFFFFIGVICITQYLITIPIYAAQILKSYFFADRHVIFGTVVRALSIAGFTVMLYDILWPRLVKRLKLPARKQPQARKAFGAVLALVICFDWLHWSLIPLPVNVQHLISSYKPYCHGPVKLDPPPADMQYSDRMTRMLDAVNAGRHSGLCVGSKLKGQPDVVDYSPEWIYGKNQLN